MKRRTRPLAHGRPLRRLAALAVGLTLVAGTAACSSGGSSASKSDTLSIALTQSPTSLNPALAGNISDFLFPESLAYAPLIHLDGDGKLSPALATEWGFTDETRTKFQLKLRQGVKFSSGKPMTAKDVVASLNYMKTSKGGVASNYAVMIKSAEATDDETVVITLDRANSSIDQVLTQRYNVGYVIGPDGIANPKMLGTATDGAGPYMADPKSMVPGDRVSFIPNPNYYDKSAIHFKNVSIKAIPNPQTALNALKSGQVAYASGMTSTGEQAEAAGFNVYAPPTAWYGINLVDREGTLTPALADVRVRQALNYAIDRKAITAALFGKYGTPTDGISGEKLGDGQDGVSTIFKYGYDPEKAKQLLKEAGYADGFDITITGTPTFANGPEMAQAVAADWAKIGVNAKIDAPNIAQYIEQVLGRQVPALAFFVYVQPGDLAARQVIYPDAGLWNRFGSSDDQMNQMATEALAQSDPELSAEGWRDVERRAIDLGWFVPVALGPDMFYTSKDLKGVSVSKANYAPDPTLFHY